MNNQHKAVLFVLLGSHRNYLHKTSFVLFIQSLGDEFDKVESEKIPKNYEL